MKYTTKTFLKIHMQFFSKLLFPIHGIGLVIKKIALYCLGWKSPSLLVEGLTIAPTYGNLVDIHHMFTSWKFLLGDVRIDDWISLTRMEMHPLDRIWCDWCSIANGITQMIYNKIMTTNLNNLNTEFSSKNNAFVHNSMKWLRHLPGTIYWEIPVRTTSEQEALLDSLTDPITRIKVSIFLEYYNYVSRTEQRWCPFKYLPNNVVYDRDYYTYSSTNKSDRIDAGKCLRKNGYVSGDNIVRSSDAPDNNNDTPISSSSILIQHSTSSSTLTSPMYKTLFEDFMNILRNA
jgi:hypothetical protein